MNRSFSCTSIMRSRASNRQGVMPVVCSVIFGSNAEPIKIGCDAREQEITFGPRL
jgi:hypothetical protein